MKVAVEFIRVHECIIDHAAEDWRGRRVCTHLIEGTARATEPESGAILYDAPGGPGEYTFVTCQPMRDQSPFGLPQRPRLFRTARDREAYIRAYLATAERRAATN